MNNATPTKAVEAYYTIKMVSALLCLHGKTISLKLRAGEFGRDVVNLGSEAAPDWRIPASGINAYLDARKPFTEPEPISARSIGELRRKNNGVQN